MLPISRVRCRLMERSAPRQGQPDRRITCQKTGNRFGVISDTVPVAIRHRAEERTESPANPGFG